LNSVSMFLVVGGDTGEMPYPSRIFWRFKDFSQ
jgi:hypothetical protein